MRDVLIRHLEYLVALGPERHFGRAGGVGGSRRAVGRPRDRPLTTRARRPAPQCSAMDALTPQQWVSVNRGRRRHLY